MTALEHPMKLAEHVPAFAQVVLQHARHVLHPEELRGWREYSLRGLNIFLCQRMPPPAPDPELPLEQLIQLGMSEGAEGIGVYLDHVGESIQQIGLIAGAAVYYCPRHGVYLWAPPGESRLFLDFYLTWPAYPPCW